MLENVLQHIKNWFVVPNGIRSGSYEIKDGGIELPFLASGQYFRVFGSVFNDGLHQYPASDLTDEFFVGVIWALAVPKAVVALSNEIQAWQEKNGTASASPYQSESKADYSYTKATDSKTGGAVTWQSAFRGRLNQWRKL